MRVLLNLLVAVFALMLSVAGFARTPVGPSPAADIVQGQDKADSGDDGEDDDDEDEDEDEKDDDAY